MKKIILITLLILNFTTDFLVANATLSEIWIEGTIVAFNKSSVTIKDNSGRKTLVPRNLTVEDIKTGEKLRIRLNSDQFEEIKKLNQKK